MKSLLAHSLAFVVLNGVPFESFSQDRTNSTVSAEMNAELKQYWMVLLKAGPNRDQDSSAAAKVSPKDGALST